MHKLLSDIVHAGFYLLGWEASPQKLQIFIVVVSTAVYRTVVMSVV